MYPPLESDLLRIFVAVAQAGNVTHAAERLGRTQSAVSMQIRKLEDSVGATLFERGPRGVALSLEGKRLLPYARRIVGLVDETTAAMRTAPLDGPVRVGIPEEYNQTVLPNALAAFAEIHPGTEVTVFCGYTEQQMEALEADEIDLAVIFDWCEGTSGEILAIDPTVWVASVAHKRHLERPVPVAVYWQSNWCRDFALRSLEQHTIPYRIAYTCDTRGGLCSAVASGLAIAPLSRSNIPPGARELTGADGFPSIDSSRVVLKRNPRRGGPAIDGMADMLRKSFGPVAAAANQAFG
ncbi:MAG TPA: LysR substrate-binding domain-containing protein [Shinella sp.]|uniref:LysR family transcriptional regulator n=1 Tax=Shinella sp. TaxID=1870904 RepID=UPI0029BE5197|nr:LysR substrate-binding domain-containing protein [Shinella sp.]MDX3977594.1 LysR substrate-binding domain-containing protein [Shinella sp.]HEV7248472.1 LysR substrate-binding domain-containing protein [Shinella sp.]